MGDNKDNSLQSENESESGIDRYQELQNELIQCNEENRSNKSNFINVMLLWSGLLGILFSASFFLDIERKNIDFSVYRIFYYLTSILFCAMIAYLYVLAADHVLLYFYRETIIERMRTYQYPREGVKYVDDVKRGEFMPFSEFRTPISTEHPFHVSTTHTLFVFTCKYFSIFMAFVFCLLIVVTQYIFIIHNSSGRHFLETVFLIFVVAFLLGSLIFYVRFTHNARRVAKRSFDIAHDNREKRVRNKFWDLYKPSENFRYLLRYFIYPRNCPQKILVIIWGFLYAVIRYNSFQKSDIFTLIEMIIIFELVLFQARYQFNDIRDVVEDEEHGESRIFKKLNPLSKEYEGSEIPIVYPGMKYHILRISNILIAFRFLLSLVCGVYFVVQYEDFTVLSMIVVTILITVLYELFRGLRCTNGIIFLLGSGYVLRFFIGVYAATMKSEFSVWNLQMIDKGIILTCVSLWTMGIFACTLSWINRAKRICEKKNISIDDYINGCQEDVIQHPRTHYQKLLRSVRKGTDSNSNGLILSRLNIWNVTYFISVVLMALLLNIVSTLQLTYRLIIILVTLACIISAFAFSRGRKYVIASIVALSVMFITFVLYVVLSRTPVLHEISHLYWIMMFSYCLLYFLVRADVFNDSFAGRIRALLLRIKDIIATVLLGKDSHKFIKEEKEKFDKYYILEGIKKDTYNLMESENIGANING